MSLVENARGGDTNDWWTPPEIVQSLGEFDLDPCSGVGQVPLAKRVYILPQDGLRLSWHGRVWCNPPYGDQPKHWIAKMAAHGNGIMLLFARIETATWRNVWKTANGVLFPYRRIPFLRGGFKVGYPRAPSALIAYGKDNVDALITSGIEGAMVLDWVTL